MISDPGILTLLPPATALLYAFWKKKIIPALLFGGLVGELLIAGFRPEFLFKYLDRVIRVGGDTGNLQLIIFSVLIGGLALIIEKNGGFKGFILLMNKIIRKQTRRTAYSLTWFIGITMFLENWSNIIINGTTMRPLYEKLKISKAELAYFIHTISINTVALVVVNSWGAFYITLLKTQGVPDPFKIVVNSVIFNFYCIASLIIVMIVMISGWRIGKMKKLNGGLVENESAITEHEDSRTPEPKAADAVYMIVPIATMIVSLLVSLYLTGDGNLSSGNGTSSVFYSVIIALMVLAILILIRNKEAVRTFQKDMFSGIGDFIKVALLFVFSLTLGDVCLELGTGQYIAGIAGSHVPVFLIAPILFILGCVISFATGTSYGTFSILIPLAIPTAVAAGINPAFIFAACISGGVFGDHASPFSGTTIITSLTARTDVIGHVQTQLPYALISVIISVVMFTVVGLFI